MITKRSLFTVLVVSGLNIFLLRAVGPGEGRQEKPMEGKSMTDQMMKYGVPGKAHELLKRYVGEWDVVISTWPVPGGEAQKGGGTIRSELIFDGRYLRSAFEGTMGGMTFRGLEIIGYDLLKRAYTTFWIDNMGTGFLVTSGSLDPAGKILTETATYPDPMTDGKTMQEVRNVTTFLSDGSYTFEMFMVRPDGKAGKSMELVCTRKR